MKIIISCSPRTVRINIYVAINALLLNLPLKADEIPSKI